MTSRSSRNVLTVVLSLLTLAASPAVAAAEVERPVQGESSNGLFLSYAPEPSEDGALCLVDSGVDENHDTEEGIIERTSVAGDGSSGEDVDTDERHGTSMAMVAGAPRNGWGMVGAWSQLKVVGVRAVQRGEDGFRFDAYRNAIQRCRQLKTEEGLPINAAGNEASETRAVLFDNPSSGGSNDDDRGSGRGGRGGSDGGSSGGGGSGGGGSSSEGPSASPPALAPAPLAVSSARLSRGRLLVAGRAAGPVRVSFYYRHGRRMRRVVRTLHPVAGGFGATIRLPAALRGARRLSVLVSGAQGARRVLARAPVARR